MQHDITRKHDAESHRIQIGVLLMVRFVEECAAVQNQNDLRRRAMSFNIFLC